MAIAAEIHENRYRAVGEYAQRASFDVAELDAWAASNRVPGSFSALLAPDSVGADLPSVRRFQPCSSLLVLIGSAFVPADMEPHDAQAQLLEAGDTGEYPNAVTRLRDLIMGRYERLLLSAAYDGDLNLYDTLTYTKIDVGAARLRYEANPGAYVQAAPMRDMEATQNMDAKVCPEKFSLYWLNAKLDEDAAFADQALSVLRRMNERRPKVLRDTTTKASAASALVNEWLVNRDLPCYRRGRAIDDFAAETVEPVTSDLSDAIEILEDSIELHRDDVVKLLRREGIAVPLYLLCDAPDGPIASTERHSDRRAGKPAETVHTLQSRKHHLSAEIAEAKRRVSDPDNVHSLWSELQKMAEEGFGALVGVSNDGVQYRGRSFDETGAFDVLTRDRLAGRLSKAKSRAIKTQGDAGRRKAT